MRMAFNDDNDIRKSKSWLSTFYTTPKPDVELIARVGTGKFSNVYRAIHTTTRVDVAVKEILKYKLSKLEWDLVINEVNVLKRLGEHPHIVTLFEVIMVSESSTLWMVTELVEGDTLDNWMLKHQNDIPVATALLIISQVISALDHCHRNNIAHRDIKPSNIMIIEKEDGEISVKLIDFGFATFKHAHNTVYCGTPRFAAPELWKRKPYLPAPVDIWAAGVLFYFLLSGNLPFRSKNIRTNVCEVKMDKLLHIDESIQEMLMKFFTVDPAKRITTNELLSSPLLNNLLDDEKRNEQNKAISSPGHFRNHDVKHVYDLSYFVVRDDILALMVRMGFDEIEVLESVEAGLYNHTAAVYYLLRRSKILETTFDNISRPRFNSARFIPRKTGRHAPEVLSAPRQATLAGDISPNPLSHCSSLDTAGPFDISFSGLIDNEIDQEDLSQGDVSDTGFMRSLRDKTSGRVRHQGCFDLTSRRERRLSLTDSVPRVASRRYTMPRHCSYIMNDSSSPPESFQNSLSDRSVLRQSITKCEPNTNSIVQKNNPVDTVDLTESTRYVDDTMDGGINLDSLCSPTDHKTFIKSKESATSLQPSRADRDLCRDTSRRTSMPILSSGSPTQHKSNGIFSSFMWWRRKNQKQTRSEYGDLSVPMSSTSSLSNGDTCIMSADEGNDAIDNPGMLRSVLPTIGETSNNVLCRYSGNSNGGSSHSASETTALSNSQFLRKAARRASFVSLLSDNEFVESMGNDLPPLPPRARVVGSSSRRSSAISLSDNKGIV
eukprot:CFRG2393T1